MRRQSGSVLYVLVFCVVLAGVASARTGAKGAQQPQQPTSVRSQLPSIPAQELVRQTVDNELKANNDDTKYMFKDRRQTPDGSKTKLMIETNQGVVAYLLAVNDKPVTPEQRQQEDQRLKNLLTNPDEQNKRKKDQQADSDRVTKMFRELPKGFIYQYVGVTPGKNGHEWVQLKFEPNPRYDPPSRELSVYKAMNGTMIIDPVAKRLVKIEANLFRDVTFGWGLLGHLDKGGHFIVEQTNIGGDRWEATYMNLQFTGKILLFKTLNLRQVETTSDYVRVPDNLTIAQGVDMLKKHVGSALAENGAAH